MNRRQFLRMMSAAPLVGMSAPLFESKSYWADVSFYKCTAVGPTTLMNPVTYEVLEKVYKECARGNAMPEVAWLNGRYL